MSQRNIDIPLDLWMGLQRLHKATARTRAQLIRDLIYTALKGAADGKPLRVLSAPYKSGSIELKPNQALMRWGPASSVMTTIDPATGFVAHGAFQAEYLAAIATIPITPKAPPPTDARAAKVAGYVANLRPDAPPQK